MSAEAPDRAEAVGGTRGGVGGRDRFAPSTRELSVGESAWLVALPCSLLLLAIILLLGPPLGRALFEPTGESQLWPRLVAIDRVRPEPTEHARFVLALLAPALAIGATWLLRGRRVPAVVPAAAATASQLALLAFVVVCVVAQREHVYEVAFMGPQGVPRTVFFTLPTLVVAVAIALLIAVVLASPAAAARVAGVTRETPPRRAIALALAALVVLAYLLSAFNTDGTINLAHVSLWDHTVFYVDEAFSILNGQAPLVDFHAQYGHLWAYIAAGGLTLLGPSLGTYTAIMLAGTAGAMATVFATLRRVVGGSSLQALALFAPFVATSFFMKLGPPDDRYSPAALFSLFPIRYAGPYVLLWLLVRRIDTASARRPLPLLAFAGLVAINNPEFGIPALGATLLALAWTLSERSLRAVGRLGLEALAGGALALALVSALTLAVGGGLPHLGMLLEYPRIFGTEGFGMLPMPSVGFHLVVYATFAGAIVLAATRGLDRPRTLDVALGWIGVFGLGVGAYFAGRSHPHVLIDLFSVWSYALVLLAVAAAGAILRRPGHRPQITELLVFAGLGVMACSLAQIPTPWSQIERIGNSQPRDVRVLTALERAIAEQTRPGEPVAVLVKGGHQISEQTGILDVTPYANARSMMAVPQWSRTLDALRRAGGRQLFMQEESLFPELIDWLARRGYRPYVEWRELTLYGFVRGEPPGAAGG